MASLDMSLDDRIKNRGSRGRGRGRGRAGFGRGPSRTFNGGRMSGAANGRRMSGAARRGPLVLNARPSSYAIAKASSKNVDAYTHA
ncbi:hypothetical protein Lalb_Chr18g0053441 [Lupinus albus]|uniref:Chromatin target of PRMT1 protein n=1 Tax=Lupinus albus TaxID=3870 RepID=A0A6A4NUL0_LUPAL|nr:hypothetical protein Lalb_Chr18g0053441 [Lupinus albus]